MKKPWRTIDTLFAGRRPETEEDASVSEMAVPEVKAPEPTAPEPMTVKQVYDNNPEAKIKLKNDELDQIGQRNEAVRNRFSDLTKKLDDIIIIKDEMGNFFKLLSESLQDLESTKAALSDYDYALLNERSAHDSLKAKNRELISEHQNKIEEISIVTTDNQRLDQQVRSYEAIIDDLQLSLREKTSSSDNFERQLDAETQRNRYLSDEIQSLRLEIEKNDVAMANFERDSTSLRDRNSLLDQENVTLRVSLEENVQNASKLSRRVDDLDSINERSRQRVVDLESALSSERLEHDKIKDLYQELVENRRVEGSSLQMKIEGLSARVDATDRLLIDARNQLRQKIEELRTSERRLQDAIIRSNTLEKKFDVAAKEATQRADYITELEKSRSTLIERSSILVKSIKEKELGLGKTEHKISLVSQRLNDATERFDQERTKYEASIRALTEQLEREKTERALAEGALNTARKDRMQLQREIANLKTTSKKMLTLQDAPILEEKPLVLQEDIEENLSSPPIEHNVMRLKH